MFEKNDVVLLEDNKEYLIVDIVTIEEDKYVYLMEIDNNMNFIVGLLNENNQLLEVTDENVIKEVFTEIKVKNNL